ncbi:MAG: response regulator transcription factor [Candidatus Obscuribacter phosphatis]|uniref:Response regulator transcription factor n=1 Tax=Candidatus Obscuribacter phosphatis TaxID=1906157 RepID=A0A8J7PBT8_9BACT|nr:response regulator transcription factor [Candidatus Obscuribacter phosphatis]
MSKILLVDDDTELTSVLGEWLEGEGYIVESADCGEDALSRLAHYEYDLVVMDVGLPDMDGYKVCSTYRSRGGALPVIMLTGRGQISDKTQGFESGADDYLTKPFHPVELGARLRALLRRPRQMMSDVLSAGHISIDGNSRRVLKSGVEIKLLPQEFNLLLFFMRNPNKVFSSEEILDKVWSNEKDTAADTVRVHINKLRKKIDEEGKNSILRTVHGSGYILDKA